MYYIHTMTTILRYIIAFVTTAYFNHILMHATAKKRLYVQLLKSCDFLNKSFVSQPFYNKSFNKSLLWISPFGLKSVTETVHESTILDQFCTGQEHVLVIFLFSAHPPSESFSEPINMVLWVLWGMFDRDLPRRGIEMLCHGGERSFLFMAKVWW